MKSPEKSLADLKRRGICIMCRRSDSQYNDPLLKSKKFFAHKLCLAYNSRLTQFHDETDTKKLFGFDLDQIEKAFKADRFHKCFLCKLRGDRAPKSQKSKLRAGMFGASAGCAHSPCRKTFHYPCAPVKILVRGHALYGDVFFYRVYCGRHHRDLDRLHLRAEMDKIGAIVDGVGDEKNMESDDGDDQKPEWNSDDGDDEPQCKSDDDDNEPDWKSDEGDHRPEFKDDDDDNEPEWKSEGGIAEVPAKWNRIGRESLRSRLDVEFVLDSISVTFLSRAVDDDDDDLAESPETPTTSAVWPSCLPPALRRKLPPEYVRYHLLEMLETLSAVVSDPKKFLNQVFLNLSAETMEEYKTISDSEALVAKDSELARKLEEGYLHAFRTYAARALEKGIDVELLGEGSNFRLVVNDVLDPTLEIRKRLPKTLRYWNDPSSAVQAPVGIETVFSEADVLLNFLYLSTRGLNVTVEVVAAGNDILGDAVSNSTFYELLAKVKRSRIALDEFPKTPVVFLAPVNQNLVDFEKYAKEVFKKVAADSKSHVTFLVVPIENHGVAVCHPTAIVPGDVNKSDTELEIVTVFATDYALVIYQIQRNSF